MTIAGKGGGGVVGGEEWDISAEWNGSESEEINVVNTEKRPLAQQVIKEKKIFCRHVSFVYHRVCCA